AVTAGVLSFLGGVTLGILGDVMGHYVYDHGSEALNALLSASHLTARNPILFNLSTDPIGLKPTNIDYLGGTSPNQGLLANGAGWAVTMPTPYVQDDGGQYAGPSAMAAGGSRPGNGTEATMGDLVNGIRRVSGLIELPPELPIENGSLSGKL